MRTCCGRTVATAAMLMLASALTHAAPPDYNDPKTLFDDICKVIDKKVGPPTEKLTDQTSRQAQAAANTYQGRTVRFELTFEAVGRSGVLHVKEKGGMSYKGERVNCTGSYRIDVADKNQWAKFKPGDKVVVEGRVGLTTTHKAKKTWDLILAVSQARPGR